MPQWARRWLCKREVLNLALEQLCMLLCLRFYPSTGRWEQDEWEGLSGSLASELAPEQV